MGCVASDEERSEEIRAVKEKAKRQCEQANDLAEYRLQQKRHLLYLANAASAVPLPPRERKRIVSFSAELISPSTPNTEFLSPKSQLPDDMLSNGEQEEAEEGEGEGVVDNDSEGVNTESEKDDTLVGVSLYLVETG